MSERKYVMNFEDGSKFTNVWKRVINETTTATTFDFLCNNFGMGKCDDISHLFRLHMGPLRCIEYITLQIPHPL